MAVFPENMNKLDLEDTKGSLSRIENYIGYMTERMEFAMRNMTRNVSEAGTSSVEVLLLLQEMSADVAKLSSTVNAMTGDITAIASGLDGVRNEVSGVKTEVSGLKTEVSGIKNNITAIQGSIGSLEARVSALEGGTATE